jgi:hypothetical protein
MKDILGTLGVVAVLAVSSLVASDAQAHEYARGLAVNDCVKAGDTGKPKYKYEGVYNSHTSESLVLDCSLPAVIVENNIDAFFSVEIAVHDQSAGGVVSCDLRFVDLDGDTVSVASNKNTSAGNGETIFAWTVSGLATNETNPYWSCTVPAGSGTALSGVQGMFWHLKD